MIERICQLCETQFQVYPSNIKAGRGKFCSRLCANKHLGQKHKGVPRPDDVRKRISESNKGKIVSLEARNNLSKAHKGKRYSAETNKKKGLPGILNPFYGKKHTAKARKAMSASHRKVSQDAKYRVNQVQIALELWRNPEYVARMMVARQAKPNRIEARLTEILNRYIPEFKYNGDFSLGVTLNGMIPDFVNINGKKEVIELFGDYFHSMEDIRWNYTELGRTMAYNSVGFKCLVIWEYELKELTEEELVNRIKAFFRKRSKNARGYCGVSSLWQDDRNYCL